MKTSTKFVVLLALGLGIAVGVYANQIVPEKAKVVANDTVRATEKAAHRVEEAVCLDSDAKCLAEKAKHRITEAAETVKDKASELKDKASTP
jgi:hypothetical protein